ncbi:pyridoxal-phosphate dependent enzyme [Streptomyces pseudogriseolus]|uniref:pyridoxal-phosphate dependent enzyme n=1 Tax=Streptomyces pseudogriseolus TaxID=36817 RepID=UPI003FA2533A
MEKIALSAWPTPMEAAPRLAVEIGLDPDDLWIKRDDLTGLGGGGNKVRKVEWLVADPLRAGADTLVTTGGPQSNHARLTAAAGARAGLNVVLVIPGSGPPDEPGGTCSCTPLSPPGSCGPVTPRLPSWPGRQRRPAPN